MRDVSFCTDAFSHPATRDHSERTLACLLWALIFANEAYLLGHGRLAPTLYTSGVRYEKEEPRPGRTGCAGGNGAERFFGIDQVRREGKADCEDLASWRVAEVRLGRWDGRRGAPVRPGHPPITICEEPYPLRPSGPRVLPGFFSRVIAPGMTMYHIIVAWPDGYIEDPSRTLGMGGEY